MPATVERLEYDPNRTAFIALIKYEDGELAYILAPQRLAVGDSVVAGEHVDVKPGNAMPLGNMPVGTIVHNVELKPGKGGQIARSAGTYAQIVGRDQDYVHPAPELGRAAPGARPLHGHGRRGVEPGPHEHLDRQGRPHALDGPASAQPRRRHEPGRPPARRRRRPHLGRPSSGHAVGHPDQGQEDPQEQVAPTKFIIVEPPRAEEEVGEDDMARSVWKGPFVDGYLLKKAEGRARVGPSRGDQDLEPPLDHPAAVRRPDLRRLQRPEARPGAGDRGHGRPQVRRVLADPHLPRPLGRPQGQERPKQLKGKHEQDQAPDAALAENEAQGGRPHASGCQPQKLNLVAQLIRGKKVATALADLEFSRKRIAEDVRKCLESAIANAENNHDLDVDDLVVAEAHVGKALVMKRFHAARPRPRGRDSEAVLAPHDRRS